MLPVMGSDEAACWSVCEAMNADMQWSVPKECIEA